MFISNYNVKCFSCYIRIYIISCYITYIMFAKIVRCNTYTKKSLNTLKQGFRRINGNNIETGSALTQN